MSENRRRRRLRVHRPVVYAVVGLVVLIGAIKCWGPMANARRQADELARLRREQATLQQEHTQLQNYQDRLASDDGVEVAARREGYVKDGDRRLVFVKGKKKTGKPDRK